MLHRQWTSELLKAMSCLCLALILLTGHAVRRNVTAMLPLAGTWKAALQRVVPGLANQCQADAWRALITHGPGCRHIHADGRIARISSRGMHALARQLTALEDLDLSDVPFTDDHDNPLDLSALTRLKRLDLSLVSILSLLLSLKACRCLACLHEDLDLSDVPFTDDHGSPLDSAL